MKTLRFIFAWLSRNVYYSASGKRVKIVRSKDNTCAGCAFETEEGCETANDPEFWCVTPIRHYKYKIV